jgi:hypothetical protein
MNIDRLNSLNPHAALQAAYLCIDSLQQFPAEQQIAGAAVLFNSLCEVLRLCPSELINKAQRMTKDADGFYTREAKAMTEYVKSELKR